MGIGSGENGHGNQAGYHAHHIPIQGPYVAHEDGGTHMAERLYQAALADGRCGR